MHKVKTSLPEVPIVFDSSLKAATDSELPNFEVMDFRKACRAFGKQCKLFLNNLLSPTLKDAVTKIYSWIQKEHCQKEKSCQILVEESFSGMFFNEFSISHLLAVFIPSRKFNFITQENVAG